MLEGLNENARDVIEEQCVLLFNDKKMVKPDKAIVREKKFKNWWSEGKLDNFEMIKYYLIDWIAKMAKNKTLDQFHLDKF